ncbi:MAG: type II toxin-antitoxin system RelB/DinJ family antitoxin [Pasteurellaceae bacterium]|nr:type II toxin-antitoxin system RelB/DinJ family antitoxin [Pasteurellaceae bacterium]
MSETYIRARVDNQIKQDATLALQAMGMTMSEFLRIAITRVAKEKAIPFDIRVPNETTLQAVQEGRAILAKAQRGFDNAETLFNELDKN